MKNSNLSKITLASLIVGFSGAADVQAANNLSITEMGSGAQVRAQILGQLGATQAPIQLAEKEGGEGKCGEGKCGEKDGGEGKCGEGKCGEKDGKDGGEAKCGEGKCGEKS